MARFIVALGLLTLATAASAGRTVEIVELSYEATLGNVSLPSSAAGRVVVRTCAECEPDSLRVNTNTQYYVGAAQLSLAELRSEADRIESAEGGADTLVVVYYGRESGEATRIKIFSSTS